MRQSVKWPQFRLLATISRSNRRNNDHYEEQRSSHCRCRSIWTQRSGIFAESRGRTLCHRTTDGFLEKEHAEADVTPLGNRSIEYRGSATRFINRLPNSYGD